MASNITRGVSFDPAEAAQEREHKNAELPERSLSKVEQAVSPGRAHGRMLDQMNAMWRERARDRRAS